MKRLITLAALAALIPAAASAQMTSTNCMGSGPFVHCDSMTMAPPPLPPPPPVAAPDGFNPGAAALGIFAGRLIRHQLDQADVRRQIANNIAAGRCDDALTLAIQHEKPADVARVSAACPTPGMRAEAQQ